MCALHCAQLLHTILHRTDLIISPLTLQTITTAPMTSIWGRGGNYNKSDTVIKFKLNLTTLKPGLIASCNIRPENGSGPFHTDCNTCAISNHNSNSVWATAKKWATLLVFTAGYRAQILSSVIITRKIRQALVTMQKSYLVKQQWLNITRHNNKFGQLPHKHSTSQQNNDIPLIFTVNNTNYQ